MNYSLIAVVAFLVTFIVNFNLLFSKSKSNIIRTYKLFIFSLLAFFLVDFAWGVVDELHLEIALIVDTYVYFFLMAASVFLWLRFVTYYLNLPKKYIIPIAVVGIAVLLGAIGLIIANFFVPVLFSYDNSKYIAHVGRYIFLISQMVIFFLSSILSFINVFLKEKGHRMKYVAISLFGLIMVIAIGIQLGFPLVAFYSSGILVGVSLLYAFVIFDEINNYRRKIIEGRVREQQQNQELGSVKEMAYTDPLTGVKNKHAYVEKEDYFDTAIREATVTSFAVVVFDLNNLKKVNDTFGHESGDKYIVKSVNLIKSVFSNMTIFRFGGDEFVVILEGDDYKNRLQLIRKFNKVIERNIGTYEPIIAVGLSEFSPNNDNTFRAVFSRADERMYVRKKYLKQMKRINDGKN